MDESRIQQRNTPYMKQNAKSEKPFSLNKHVIRRLEAIAIY